MLMSTVLLCRLQLGFERDVRDYSLWKAAIMKVLHRFSAAEREIQKRLQHANASSLKRGKLRVRRDVRSNDSAENDEWSELFIELTPTEFIALRKNPIGQMEVVHLVDVKPGCCVFETNYGPFAFEIVTPQKVLHVQAESQAVCDAWLAAIRSAIANSQPSPDDPLYQLAMSKIDEDAFYDVSFHEKKPLGIVFERSCEWAVVKHSNERATGISIGSVLTSINGKSCLFTAYDDVIDTVKNWQPPLHLGFRRAPHKSGYLVKLSRERRGKIQNTWKERFFELGEGRLLYRSREGAEEVKQEMCMMGSTIALLSANETGKFFCFKVVSGSVSMIMQAVDMDDMMEWAACIYHACEVANGGVQIIARERARLRREAAEDVAEGRTGSLEEVDLIPLGG